MELRIIWKIIKRRKWIIIQGFMAVFIAAMAWTLLVKPTYEAKAKILVGDPSKSLSSLLSGIGIGEKSSQMTTGFDVKSNMENQKNLVVLSILVNKMASRLQLRDSDGYLYSSEKILDKQMIALSPRPYVSVDVGEDSTILELIADSTDPAEAQMIIAALSEYYIEDNLNRIREGFTGAKTFIEQQMNSVRENYVNALKAIEVEKKKEKSIDLKSESSLLIQNIERFTTDQITYGRKRYELEASINEIKGQIKDIDKYQKESMEFENNPMINDLKKSLYKLITDLEGVRTKYTDQHPDIIELNNKIAETKNLIQKEVEKTFKKEILSIDPVYSELVKKLAAQYISLEEVKAQERAIPQYLKVYEARLLEMPEKEFIQTQLQNDLAATRKIYESLLDYLHKVGVAEAMTISDVKIVDAPIMPNNPISPNKALNAVIGLVLGVFVGFGFGFLSEYLDNTIKEPDDLRNYDLIFLGSIPKLGNPKMGLREVFVSRTDANDPRYESYRGILTSISYMSIDRSYKKLLVTSFGPREGKSTTVVNLGILYSAEGKRTLLVDTDLRRPKLHEYFNLPNSKGLTNVLIGEAGLDEAIIETGIKGLSILPSGAAPPDSGQILKSHKIQQITEELAKGYDIVIFDSAPILIKNDAVVLMNCADEMVIVARNNMTTHQGILRANEILKNSKIKPLGVILNDINGRHI